MNYYSLLLSLSSFFLSVTVFVFCFHTYFNFFFFFLDITKEEKDKRGRERKGKKGCVLLSFSIFGNDIKDILDTIVWRVWKT